MIYLTVTNPFSGYQKGQRITDEAEVKKILESNNAANVVKVKAPEPAQKPEKPAKAPKPTTTEEPQQ